MKTLIASLALLGSALLAPQAQAQTTPMPATTDTALYQALGEKAGITRLVDDFVARLVADARIADMFKKTNLSNLRTQLTDQFCVVSGGPCQYTGADMKSVHQDLDIQKQHFNALVEDLQAAMDAKNIPFSKQNQLLARLAPMHRDVIAP